MGEHDKIVAGALEPSLVGVAEAEPRRSAFGGRTIYRLVYVSRSLVPPLGIGGDALVQDILDVSIARNVARDVTGALMFNDAHFAQVLEGPRLAVRDIFQSILKDRRHSDVEVVEETWLENRDFANWAMARVDGGDAPKLKSRDIGMGAIILRNAGRGRQIIDMMKYFLVDN